MSGFRGEPTDNPSATLLAAWTDAPTFVWLLTEEILPEYVEVLERLHVRLRERLSLSFGNRGTSFALFEVDGDRFRPIEMTHHSVSALNRPKPIRNVESKRLSSEQAEAKVNSPSDPLQPRRRKARPRRKRRVIRKK